MPSPAVYDVRPVASALRDLEGPLDLPNRSAQLPPVYVWAHDKPHPQRHPASMELHGKTYVVMIDGSPEGKARADRLAQMQQVPLGREAVAQSLGLLRMEPGDFVAVRHFDSDGDPMNDICQEMLSLAPTLEAARIRLDAATQRILGRREDRTAESVKFERSPHAQRARGGDRGYGIAQLVQLSRLVEAPAASVKVYEGQLDEDQQEQKEFLTAAATVIVETLRQTVPEHWQEVVKEFNEVINGPVTGCEGNHWFPSFQVNIAPAQDGDGDGSLRLEMKIGGISHMDTHDAVACLSCMLVVSDLPKGEGWEPGRFHFLAHGFYINLEPHYTVYFSGRLPHGGTAPLAPPGQKAPSWAYRTVVIGYPPKYIMDGEVRHSLAAMPNKAEPLYISPEMTGVNSQYPDNIVTSNHSNYACDGVMTMTPQAHFNFFVRALLLLVIMLLRQLPRKYNVHVDRDKFLSAFSAEDEDETITPSKWELGPEGAVHQEPNPKAPRERAVRRYKELYAHRAPAIHRADNEYPEPAGQAGRQKKTGSTKPGGGELSEKTKARRAKQARETELAAKAAAMKAMFALGGLSAAWDAAVDKTMASDAEALDDIDDDMPLTDSGDEDGQDAVVQGSGKRKRTEDDEYQLPQNQVEDQGDGETKSTRKRRRTDPRDEEQAKPEDSVNQRETAEQAAGANEEQNGTDIQYNGTEVALTVEAMRLHNNESDIDPQPVRTRGEWSDDSSLTSLSDEEATTDEGGKTDAEECPSDESDDEQSARSDSDDHGNDDGGEEEITGGEGTRVKAVRKFVKAFSKKMLKDEIKRVEEVTKHVDGVDPDSLRKALDLLGQIDIGSLSSTSLAKSPDQILDTLGAVKMLRDTAEWHDVWTNVFRQRVMLCERHLASVLTGRLEELARAAMDASTTDTDGTIGWLHRLLDHIRTNLECGMEIKLNSSAFIPHIVQGTLYFEKAHKRAYTAVQLHEQAPKIAVAAVRSWLGMTNEHLTKARASFVTILMDHYGPGALLLPDVWGVYIRMPCWLSDVEVFNQRRTKTEFRREQHRTLRRIVATSAAADHTSEKFRRLHDLKQAYRDLVDRVHYSLEAVGQPAACKKRKAKVINDDYDVQTEVTAGPLPQRGDVALAPGKIKQMLQASALVAKGQQNGATRLQRRIAAKTDLLQPLRETGVSRTRINGRNGETLTATHACTRAGFFSLLVFRNILYNTPYLHSTSPVKDIRVLFKTPADFFKHLDTIRAKHGIKTKKKESYFCNKQALSQQPISGRSTATATKFWKLASSIPLCGLSQQPAKFEDMRVKLDASADAAKIPGFGKLSRFLTLVDMCATGIVEKPSVDEMGRCIYRLGAGAKSGLILLGYLDNTGGKPTQNDVVQAFKSYYDVAHNITTSEEGRDIQGWDTLVGEHSLCKLKRLWEDLA